MAFQNGLCRKKVVSLQGEMMVKAVFFVCTCLKIRDIMKFVVRCQLLFFAFLIQFNLSVIAQVESDSSNMVFRSSCQSIWTKYNNLSENYSIVRSNEEDHVI